MFYVYVLKSDIDGKLYTGYTHNIRKRIFEHNKGLNFSTKHRKPLKMIYCEVCLDEQDAKAREKYLKTGMGKRYLRNRLKFFSSG